VDNLSFIVFDIPGVQLVRDLLKQIFMGYLPLKNIDDLLCFQLISNMVGCS